MTTFTHFNIADIDWKKMQGQVPAIIQDHQTFTVLMLGYMNQEALQHTLTNKKVTFFSRSKQRLWQKGETSGHYLELVNLYLDCDQDTLLILAQPKGPTCHLGQQSCFNPQQQSPWQFIQDLQLLLQHRQQHPQTNSYTTSLFSAGILRIAQKVGEEGVEVALAAVARRAPELIEETADLIFHLLVLLSAKKIDLSQVIELLQQRHQHSYDHTE